MLTQACTLLDFKNILSTICGGQRQEEIEMDKKQQGRRRVLKGIGASGIAVAASSLPMPWIRKVSAADSIIIGVPSSLSTPYGVADDTDPSERDNPRSRGD